MRKIIFMALVMLFFSCEKNETNDLLPDIDLNVFIDMRLPMYQKLQIQGSWMYIDNEGINGILLINKGGKMPYKAFDRACPDNTCTKKMVFDGSLKLKCECHNVEYSRLDGSPQDNSHTRSAREYNVFVLDKFNIHITN